MRARISENNNMDYAIAGGLLGIQTSVDPTYTRNDGMSGSIVLKEADYLESLQLGSRCEYRVFEKIVVLMESFMMDEKLAKEYLRKDAIVRVNINSNTIRAMVINYSKSKKKAQIFLVKPIPITSLNNHITIMLDNSTDSMKNDMDTSVLGAGKITGGADAFKCI